MHVARGGRPRGSEMSGQVKSTKLRVHSISRRIYCADVYLLAQLWRSALRPALDELRGKMIFALLFEADEGDSAVSTSETRNLSSDSLTSQQIKAPVMRLFWKPQQDLVAHLVSDEILMLVIHTV